MEDNILTGESTEAPRDDKQKDSKDIVVNEAKVLKTATKTLKFHITPLMRLWIDKAIEYQTDSPTIISSVSKIRAATWYHWRTLPGWNDWFLEQWKEKRKQWVTALDVMGMKRAAKSYDYWKAMNNKAGELLEGSSTNIYGDKVVAIMGGLTNNKTVNDSITPVDDK